MPEELNNPTPASGTPAVADPAGTATPASNTTTTPVASVGSEDIAGNIPATNTDTPAVEPTEPTYKEDITLTDLKYNDKEVAVSIPADAANLLAEKGLDISEVAKELYSSEGFELSEDTKNKLYDAFGKWQVDAYLDGVRANNELTLSKYESDVKAAEAAQKEAWDATIEIMGGEDRWDDMAAYAAENLDNAEIEEFNEVMKSGTLRMQQLMIKDLYQRFSTAGAPKAATVLNLESGKTSGEISGNATALTGKEFLDLMISGEYYKDPERYDKLRSAGIAKGL